MIPEGTFIFGGNGIKSRVFRVCDKRSQFLYWTVEFKTEIDVGVFSDFQDGAFLGISQADKDRAITRISKGLS